MSLLLKQNYMNFILINLLRFMTLIDLGQFVANVVRQLEIVDRRYVYLEFCLVM